MMSLETEVLERHLSLFYRKSVLLSGGIKDQFPQKLAPHCQSVQVWSCYFDYARTQSAVNFSIEFQGKADLIVYYWTKNKQEVQFQLMQLLANAQDGQEILIIGENRCGVRSAEKILSPFGDIAKIDSARRCGLYHFSLKKRPHFSLNTFWKTYQHPQLNGLTVHSLPGVFSANELDVGTALLLSTLNQSIKGKVLDLGCGAGVIGSMVKKINPKSNVTMTDIHAMALESARKTLSENRLDAEVFASDVFSDIEGKFDLIISNPPFHDGIDTAYQAVNTLITQAKRHLNQGGELRIVANAFLPYPDLLQQHFGTFDVLAQTSKFKVYSVKN
ncbi:16S rRNA (guanine(1207)-N(2))-methyltransferase [Rodentibacter caecimuris]|uniref:Ribosomal RNA small subunit methyltransferase C n=1 Tax=Rodentibacter caecimuris TaxID=1796644 RepID=A0A9X8W0C1_9PAST|nr:MULTISPECIES: 16S rRNA (guanine(1207)-N(2))-methyltransferase RsmC [Pasteurellaceae]MCR1837506.1 16S rRNA (guanine(1207)-N(2))-methyltransferase RsmC [Pasteurella caecimuris]MCU0107632.1 16S rRNA (guanine(1207)-N(2))-methyltransferase RsmC [Pasteurella caecimuris]OOF73173.1 16S rRNA (guanine(1207)-N(2))-methyltransferase [Rodentibacter heylii]OOF75324.1 16S rRNA (guanine(1207)-N(2))-methyltransferase [Rodentibacter heylii]OOF75785.1 16S rRNA (guanine(1207)-N(2))-methyltransferase [Rodentiba